MMRIIVLMVLMSGIVFAEVQLGMKYSGSMSSGLTGIFETIFFIVIVALPALVIATGVGLIRFNKETKRYLQEELVKADEAYNRFLEKECVTISYDQKSLSLLEEIRTLEKQLRSLT